jgi:hypothetical protein
MPGMWLPPRAKYKHAATDADGALRGVVVAAPDCVIGHFDPVVDAVDSTHVERDLLGKVFLDIVFNLT